MKNGKPIKNSDSGSCAVFAMITAKTLTENGLHQTNYESC